MVSYKSLPVSYFYSFCMCATSLSVTTYNYKPKKRSTPFTFYLYRVLCMQGCETFNFQQPLNIIYMYVKSLLYLISLPLLSLPLSPLPPPLLQWGELSQRDCCCQWNTAVQSGWRGLCVWHGCLHHLVSIFLRSILSTGHLPRLVCKHKHAMYMCTCACTEQYILQALLIPVHCHVCYFPFKCTFSLSPSLPPRPPVPVRLLMGANYSVPE